MSSRFVVKIVYRIERQTKRIDWFVFVGSLKSIKSQSKCLPPHIDTHLNHGMDSRADPIRSTFYSEILLEMKDNPRLNQFI